MTSAILYVDDLRDVDAELKSRRGSDAAQLTVVQSPFYLPPVSSAQPAAVRGDTLLKLGAGGA